MKRLKDYKVILIGGSPMIGKTSLAIEVASRLKYSCISTDDIGEGVRAVTESKDLNPMKGFNYQDYYLSKTVDELIEDTKTQHSKMEPAISAVINAHSTWGHPAVIEGWNIYPELFSKMADESIFAIWLIGNEELFRNRILLDKSFTEGVSAKDDLIDKFVGRSIWHNVELQQQIAKRNCNYINVSMNDSIDNISENIFLSKKI